MESFLQKYRTGELHGQGIPEKPIDFVGDYLPAPRPPNEKKRNKALWYYRLGNNASDTLDKVVRLAKDIFNVSSILISIIDEDKQIGFETWNFQRGEMERDSSFCGHAILNPDQQFVITDASKDWRFAGNPHVVKEDGLRFYAGSPILIHSPLKHPDKVTSENNDGNSDDFAAGMVCLIDNKPHEEFSPVDSEKLHHLSAIVKDLLDLHLHRLRLAERNNMSDSIVDYINQMNSQQDPLESAARLVGKILHSDHVFVQEITSKFTDVTSVISVKLKNKGNIDLPLHNNGYVWESEDLSESAIVFPFLNNDYVFIVYSDDKYRVFDTYDVSYVIEMSQSITVVLQQSLIIKANKAKTVFIESVSHELRTPLHGILTSVELLQEDEQLSGSQKGMLNMVHSSGKNLISVINGLLDFQRWEQNEVRVSQDVFNVLDLQQDVMDAFALTHSRDCQLLLQTKVPARHFVLVSDVSIMKQVLLNLVDNAVKFTTEGQVILKVELHNENSNSVLVWTVVDSGKGMSPDFINNHLFKPFSKEDPFTQGVGLGLAISHHLCQASAAKISVVSSVLGKGTTMEYSVPVTLHDSQTDPFTELDLIKWNMSQDNQHDSPLLENVFSILSDHTEWKRNAKTSSNNAFVKLLDYATTTDEDILSILETDDKLGTSSFVLLFCEADEHPLLPEEITKSDRVVISTKPIGLPKLIIAWKDLRSKLTTISNKKTKKGIKVLIVDDNAVNRNMLAMYCKKRKIPYDTASDGLLAYAKFKEHEYDVIFMDIQMPNCDGPSAVKLIRKHEKVCNHLHYCFIIMLTGLSTDDVKQESYAVGANNFMVKPITLKTLDFILDTIFD